MDQVECRTYRVPTDQPDADGTLEWTSTTVVVVQARAGDETGLGWTYAGAGSKVVVDSELARAVIGSDPMDVPGSWERMVRACRNLGRPGVVSSAVSAVDIALRDLEAKLLGATLVSLFGRCRTAAPVYGSGGFTACDDSTAASWSGTAMIQVMGWAYAKRRPSSTAWPKRARADRRKEGRCQGPS